MKGGRRGASVKTLKRMLKKAGLKTSGRKATLTRRAKKAHLKVAGGRKSRRGGMYTPINCGPNRWYEPGKGCQPPEEDD